MSWKLVLPPIIVVLVGVLFAVSANNEADQIPGKCETLFDEIADTLEQAFDEREQLTPASREAYLEALDSHIRSANALLDEMKGTDEIGEIAWPFAFVGAQRRAQDLALGLFSDFPEVKSRYHGLVPSLYQCNRFVAVATDEVLSYSELREMGPLSAGWDRRRLERDLIYLMRSMEESDGMEPLTEMLIDARLLAVR